MASAPNTSPMANSSTDSSPPSTSPASPQSPPPSSPPPASTPPPTQSSPPPTSSGSSPSPPSPSPPPPPYDNGVSPPSHVGSPPEPRASPSPPPPRHSGGSSSPSSGNEGSNGGVSSHGRGKSASNGDSSPHVAAAVAGVVLGVTAFAVLMAIAACVCCAKKKKKKPAPHMNHMPYYTDESGNLFYASSAPKWQSQGHSGPMDHGLPAPPGGWHPHGGQYGMSAAQMSGEMMTSGAYSGQHGAALPPPSPNVALGFSKSAFTYEELAAATGDFAGENMLGQGGFGYVYKGVLGSGKEVAVKQLRSGSRQGEREFQAEVEIISRVHHRHLVSLVGYCIAGASQRMLVYEFVPNNTLEHHLHGKGVPVMDWPRRLDVALGSARGLAYLHEDCHPKIIHRDIKTANILLDENFEAKVADFGLAKLTTDTNTHVSTRVMGTFGYLAPEYASSGKLTDKSDVFSFGVMLLELITGRRPVDPTKYMEDCLVDWARPLLARALTEEAGYDELVDPRLENNFDRVEMERMAACAAASVRHSARRRPKMKQIVRALEGDISLDNLSEVVKPGQSMLFSSGSEHDSANYASNISRFRKVAFKSGEYSNEYSGTSEYGLNPSHSSSESGR